MLRTFLIASFIAGAVGVSVYQVRSSCSAHAGDTATMTSTAAPIADEGGCGAHAAAPVADEGGCAAHAAAMAAPTAEEHGGCGAHAELDAVAPAPQVEGTVAFDGPPPIGAKAVCPVMNKPHVVDQDTTASVYQGKTYAFCCDGCKQAFDAEPAKYLVAYTR